jgi:hypothetical protein
MNMIFITYKTTDTARVFKINIYCMFDTVYLYDTVRLTYKLSLTLSEHKELMPSRSARPHLAIHSV